MLAWGTNFDREDGKGEQGNLLRTREAAHSLPRILHANGDATGREIGRALLERVEQEPRIHLHERVTTRDLILRDGRVVGVTALDAEGTPTQFVGAGVLLASGGAGQVYSDTTNPSVATGDGIAMAYRAGAAICDMEFYQFHPTALSLPGAPHFLLSEALRGEGAYLRNHHGERFMERYHPSAELAPRDVVARAITREALGDAPGENLPVYLDMRHVRGKDLHRRFPGISSFLQRYGLELEPRSDSGAACGALFDGWRVYGPVRSHHAARPVCGRRSGVYRRARREPPGQQFTAGGAGLWRTRRRGNLAGANCIEMSRTLSRAESSRSGR